MADANDELVAVQVPRRLLMKVYGFIAQQNGSTSEVRVAAPAAMALASAAAPTIGRGEDKETESSAGSGEWSREEIERDYRDSPDSMKLIMKAMAEREGETLTTDDFAEYMSDKTGRRVRTSSISGVFGAYGRRVKSRYGKGSWWFSAKWDDEHSGVLYTMSPELAEIIRPL